MDYNSSFSVLISCYNNDSPLYLDLAIKSIFHSSIIPDEVLLVVDGPISDSLNNVIVENCKNFSQLKTLRLIKNVGLGCALREGLKMCSNELVARMDSDDINNFYRFEKLLLEFEKNSKLVLCGTFIEEFDDFSERKMIRSVPLTQKSIYNFSKLRNPFNHVSVMFKKSVVSLVGSYENVLYFEDYFLWKKILDKGYKVANIDFIGVSVRAGDSMINRRKGIQYFFYELHFLKLCYKKKFINEFEFIANVFMRGSIRLLGSQSKIVYQNILRVNNKTAY